MLWHKLFNKVVTDLGYRSTHTDPCQYFYIDAEGRQSEFCLHIDDVLGASMSPTEGTRLARAFSKAGWEFESNNRIKMYLGMYFGRSINGNIVTYNGTYVDDILRDLKLEHVKPRSTPCPPNIYYTPNTGARASAELHRTYRTAIGSCNWMARSWRPTAIYATSTLSMFLANPSVEHFEGLLWLLGYFKATKRYGSFFRPPTHVTQYIPEYILRCDANWGGDYDGRSTSSYLIGIHSPDEINEGYRTGQWPHGNLIAWYSKRQSITHTSSEGSESHCLVEGTKAILALRNQSMENLMPLQRPTPSLVDNSSTVVNCHEGKISRRNRSQAIHLGFLKENHGTTIEAIKIKGEENDADIGSKPISVKVFQFLHPRLEDQAM
jgi:hypothetical protein